jgi:DNA polymerase-3 subunit alpha
MGYSSYYLIVADFINWAKNNGIPVGAGRGSGAASLVAYVIGITTLDPIRYDLIFERFLNPERVSLPDFDVDFCSRRREEVYNYLVEHYGQDRTTKIATFGFLKAKSAITDVGRVLGYPVKTVKEITALVPLLKDEETLVDAINHEPELKKIVTLNAENKKLIELAIAVEGAVRNVGVHAGGAVICSIPVSDIVPLTVATDGIVTTQFDMKDAEEVGLVKFDLLGIETLTIMDYAVKHIKKFKDADFDLESITFDDPEIFKMLALGDTVGTFQLESTGMQRILRDLKPDCFEDIIAVNALYRPGPLSGGMVDQYINRKHGREKIEYPFPELEQILKETYGILVYQEQVQRIAATLAGYSLGEADLLRRAMGKKKPAEMAKQKQRFIEGAKQKGHDPKKAEDLFELMAKFADYGFNKAHAAVYAVSSYKTAYLKNYYPAEFLSALLTSKMGKDIESAGLYISDAIAHGIKILPPDINESVYDFAPRAKNIRFGFGGIKNIGSSAIENILEERGNNGLFKGFVDFCTRVDTRRVNKKTLENLIKAGAFDSLGINRGLLFGNIDKIMNHAAGLKKDAESGQCNLFAGTSEDPECKTSDQDLMDMTVPQWTASEQLQYEKEVIGFYISDHPMTQYDAILRQASVPEIASIHYMPPDSLITAAGILNFSREYVTKSGKVMAFYTLEDRTGRIEATAFEDVYNEIKNMPDFGTNPVLCYAKVSGDLGAAKLLIQRVKELEEGDFVFDLRARGDKISTTRLEELCCMLPKNSGLVPVNLDIIFPNEGEVSLDLGKGSFSDCLKAGAVIKQIYKREELSCKWLLES